MGNSMDALSLMAQNDDDDNGQWSRLSFFAEAGQTYVIAVDSADGTPGTLALAYQMKHVLPGDVNADEKLI
jgi:hypothetical protein